MHMHELEAGGAPSERHGPAQPLARGAQQFTQHGLAGTIDWCTGPPRLSAEVSDGIQARVQRAARGCALQQPRAAQHDQDCQRRQRPPGHARGLMRSQCAQQGPWCGSPQALALDSLRSVAVRNRPAPCPFPVQSRGCACGVGRPQGSPGLSSSGPPFVMAARGHADQPTRTLAPCPACAACTLRCHLPQATAQGTAGKLVSAELCCCASSAPPHEQVRLRQRGRRASYHSPHQRERHAVGDRPRSPAHTVRTRVILSAPPGSQHSRQLQLRGRAARRGRRVDGGRRGGGGRRRARHQRVVARGRHLVHKYLGRQLRARGAAA